MQSKAFDGLRRKKLMETSAEDFLAILNGGKVASISNWRTSSSVLCVPSICELSTASYPGDRACTLADLMSRRSTLSLASNATYSSGLFGGVGSATTPGGFFRYWASGSVILPSLRHLSCPAVDVAVLACPFGECGRHKLRPHRLLWPIPLARRPFGRWQPRSWPAV